MHRSNDQLQSITSSAWTSRFGGIAIPNTALLRSIFGDMESPGCSLLLFICNVTQVVFMFATWYYRGAYKEGALL